MVPDSGTVKGKLDLLNKRKLVPSSEVYEECFKSGNPEKNHGTALGKVSKNFQLFINEKKYFKNTSDVPRESLHFRRNESGRTTFAQLQIWLSPIKPSGTTLKSRDPSYRSKSDSRNLQGNYQQNGLILQKNSLTAKQGNLQYGLMLIKLLALSCVAGCRD